VPSKSHPDHGETSKAPTEPAGETLKVPRGERFEDYAVARAKADTVCRRALADVQFRERLRLDPRRVLIEEGFSEPGAENIARELRIDQPGMSDHALMRCDFSCAHTGCFWSCFWTD
jgi:hypothetical protein